VVLKDDCPLVPSFEPQQGAKYKHTLNSIFNATPSSGGLTMTAATAAERIVVLQIIQMIQEVAVALSRLFSQRNVW
jgi:hypothetical protein